jgi:hypothetical protein
VSPGRTFAGTVAYCRDLGATFLTCINKGRGYCLPPRRRYCHSRRRFSRWKLGRLCRNLIEIGCRTRQCGALLLAYPLCGNCLVLFYPALRYFGRISLVRSTALSHKSKKCLAGHQGPLDQGPLGQVRNRDVAIWTTTCRSGALARS